jgi:uncharacterized membrane protein
MKKSLNKYTIINIVFYGGLVIKAMDALIEFIGGLLLLILSHNSLNRLIWLIALPELREDPKDILMNYFITLGQDFSISSQHLVAIYMLLHGTTKLTVIVLLLKRKLWAYPLAAVVFGLFIAYEIYSYMHSPSVLLLLLTITDAVMTVVIILEYKRLKTGKAM